MSEFYIKKIRQEAEAILLADSEMRERGGCLPGNCVEMAKAVLEFSNDLKDLDSRFSLLASKRWADHTEDKWDSVIEFLLKKWGVLE